MTAADLMAVLGSDGEDSLLPVYVQPRASRTRVVGIHDGRLKLAVAAPPVDGAANDALVKALASWLGCARRDVRIEQGTSGRRKRVRCVGLSPQRVAARISAA